MKTFDDLFIDLSFAGNNIFVVKSKNGNNLSTKIFLSKTLMNFPIQERIGKISSIFCINFCFELIFVYRRRGQISNQKDVKNVINLLTNKSSVFLYGYVVINDCRIDVSQIHSTFLLPVLSQTLTVYDSLFFTILYSNIDSEMRGREGEGH